MRHKSRPSVRTQFLIFNLFGDYISPRGCAVWTSGLLRVLAELQVSERAARSTLSRMKRKGWLGSRRQGRRSLYHLTRKGKALLDEGEQRIFGPRERRWDGNWHIVIYSLPQEMRSLRRQLRAQLSWLGFGMFLPGTMVSAHPRRSAVRRLIEELGIQAYVHYFTSASLEMKDSQEVVQRCWDLAGLNRRYSKFIRQHEQAYEESLAQWEREGKLSPRESFVARFWATYEYSSFPREDPYLPAELLPSNWCGTEAAKLMANYRSLLREPAEAYIDQNMGLVPQEQEEVGGNGKAQSSAPVPTSGRVSAK